MKTLTIVLALALTPLVNAAAQGQDQQEVASEEQQSPLLNAGELDQLVAPIALYPDPLLAQVLMASTYPLEVVQADRFAKANKGLKGDKLTQALDKKDWDASVKQLVSTPTVLAMMSDQLDWTEKLGDAVLAQQAGLMDAIQRLRGQAQANGKLVTTKQQKVTVSQEANKQVIEIEPASPEVVYVPYYNPSVVYGEWAYPDYPPYYYPPPVGYVVGGAIATGLAWGAAFAIGHEIWDNFDWDRGDININTDRNVNRNVDRNLQKWEHNSYHRRGVSYNSDAVRNKFAKGNARPSDQNLDRGRGGQQAVNVGKPGGPELGGGTERPKAKPNVGQIEQGLKKGPGKKPQPKPQKANVGEAKAKGGKSPGKKPQPKVQKANVAKAKAKGGAGGNAFDLSDGAKAKDFSKRGQASLGNRGAKDFSRPSGGRPNVARAGGGSHHVSRPGGAHVSRGGGGGRGGGGRGGGGRRSDIRLKEDLVPLVRLGNGLELYRFRYKGSDHTLYVGVMAQDVQKIDSSAVWRGHDGYLTVDYDQIGVKFMTWKEWLARRGANSFSSP